MKPGQEHRLAAADALSSSSSAGARGAGERAGFDYADEYLHRSQPIHGPFLHGMHAIARSGLRDPQGLNDLDGR